MKKYNVLMGLLIITFYLLSAQAYSPKFPEGRYYFMSENKQFLIEVTPTVMQSRDSKHLLVKSSQSISLYKKDNHNAWKEKNSFKVGRMHLIKEVLIPNNGKTVIIRIDENPMARNSNKDDGIFIFSPLGKKIKSYSHFSVFDKPGIFRNMKLAIENKQNKLIITNKNKVTRLNLPK